METTTTTTTEVFYRAFEVATAACVGMLQGASFGGEPPAAEAAGSAGGEPPAAEAAGSAEGHGVRCSDDRSLSDADADYHGGVRLLDRLWDACDSLDADKSGSVQASGDLGHY